MDERAQLRIEGFFLGVLLMLLVWALLPAPADRPEPEPASVTRAVL